MNQVKAAATMRPTKKAPTAAPAIVPASEEGPGLGGIVGPGPTGVVVDRLVDCEVVVIRLEYVVLEVVVTDEVVEVAVVEEVVVVVLVVVKTTTFVVELEAVP
jgi:hypothetical protein